MPGEDRDDVVTDGDRGNRAMAYAEAFADCVGSSKVTMKV